MSYINELRKIVGHNEILSIGATIIVMKENKILLQLRSDIKTWGIPGGAIELGETLEEAATRELAEETGLICDEFELLNVFSGKEFFMEYPNGDKVWTVPVVFLAINVKGELNCVDGESLELEYFNLEELPNLENRAGCIIKWLKNREILLI
ncbi:NUDIX hydrolase [Anaerorhabdus furcosa]|uniref:ADP-ribose pyrophosphatase YjhB, NUDIX family n=1 Tax=Anaerorhabdus furcosa TaxID=118967 RepID=A0A1T4NPE5_9FIRM|nr:NUDIX domain-containing protein [Anaerorhabdus furcosa]SJZ81089.1 ADP-ribose pyrophosphatase YjhB, NUDIX family [Anaerorhabdus furcosa]